MKITSAHFTIAKNSGFICKNANFRFFGGFINPGYGINHSEGTILFLNFFKKFFAVASGFRILHIFRKPVRFPKSGRFRLKSFGAGISGMKVVLFVTACLSRYIKERILKNSLIPASIKLILIDAGIILIDAGFVPLNEGAYLIDERIFLLSINIIPNDERMEPYCRIAHSAVYRI